MRHPNLRHELVGVVLLAVAASTPVARADVIELIGGFFLWSDAGTWDNLDGPDRPPATGDTAVFALGGGGYNFFFDGDESCDEMRFEQNSSTWMSIGGGAPHTLTVHDDAWVHGDLLQVQSLDLDIGGNLLIHGDAELRCGGVDLDVGTNILIGNGSTGDGTLVCTGSSTSLSTGVAVCVGGLGDAGTLRLDAGATADITVLAVTCGNVPGSTGLLEILGGSTVTASQMFVNTDGPAGASAEIRISGPGSELLTTTDGATIGAASGGSPALIVIDDHGRYVRPSQSSTLVQPSGTILVQGGGEFALSGLLTVVGGTISCADGGLLDLVYEGSRPEVILQSGALLDAGEIFSFGDACAPLIEPLVTVTAGSEARVGLNWTIAPGVDECGRTEVRGVNGLGEQGRLHATNAESRLTVGGAGVGTLAVDTGGLVDGFGEVIVGAGPGGVGHLTVDGSGGLGTPSRLETTGTLHLGGGPDGPAPGAAAHVNVIEAAQVSAGSIALAAQAGTTAELTMAEVGGLGGPLLTSAGRIDIAGNGTAAGGTATVSMEAFSTMHAGVDVHVWPGGSLHMDGGTVSADRAIAVGPFACPIGVDSGGLITGHGTLDPGAGFGAEVRICGRLDPGPVSADAPAPAGATPRRFDVQGPLRLIGVLEADLGGTNAGVDHDQVVATGTVILDGRIEVVLDEGFTPEPGANFDIITAPFIDVPFSVAFDLPPGLEAEVHPARVTIVAVDQCPADIDDSGDVGFADILAIIGAWGPCAGACPEDLNGNGAVDFGDILVAIGAWGACP
jgi:hypothetical protein